MTGSICKHCFGTCIVTHAANGLFDRYIDMLSPLFRKSLTGLLNCPDGLSKFAGDLLDFKPAGCQSRRRPDHAVEISGTRSRTPAMKPRLFQAANRTRQGIIWRSMQLEDDGRPSGRRPAKRAYRC